MLRSGHCGKWMFDAAEISDGAGATQNMLIEAKYQASGDACEYVEDFENPLLD